MQNLTRDGVRADVGAAVVGAGRVETVQASGSARRDLMVDVPAWARGIQVDVQMPRAEWSRFTDLGLSLFDSTGHQLAKSPVNYSFGRVEHEMENGHSAQRVTISLFPGLALANDTAPWAIDVTIRLYGDSAQALAPADERALTLGPGRAAHDAVLGGSGCPLHSLRATCRWASCWRAPARKRSGPPRHCCRRSSGVGVK